MVPMPSAEPAGNVDAPGRLDARARARLLDLARQAIAAGLEGAPAPVVDLDDWPATLTEPAAAFVTLHLDGRLRGCIGQLQPVTALPQAVADQAWAAAFRDPRFAPLHQAEFTRLQIEVSVLTPPQPLPCDSEAALLAALQPGEDGLILSDGRQRATFLPSVWAQLPDPVDFLRALRVKAGLAPDHWSATLQVARYRTESFGPSSPTPD